MNEQWEAAFDRLRRAEGRSARIEAERALHALATESGERVLARFREIPPDERLELVQDAFVRLLDKYSDEAWSFALFVTVLRNIALDVVKSRSHQTRRDAVRDAPSRDDEPAAAAIDALASRVDEAGHVANVISAQQIMLHVRSLLSARDLTWLELVLTDVTHQEIADSYRVPKATVDKAMQRAWEKIRVAFGEEVRP